MRRLEDGLQPLLYGVLPWASKGGERAVSLMGRRRNDGPEAGGERSMEHELLA